MNDDEIRGDKMNPVVQFERELFAVFERYAEVRKAKPGYFAAALVEYADTFRQFDDVSVDVERIGDDVFLAHFDDSTAWIGAPRSEEYGDVDVDALAEKIDQDVTDEGITTEEIELVDVDQDEGGPDA